MENKQKTLVVPMIIVAVMFAVLGFAVGVNAFFIPFVKHAFHISTTMSYLVMTATFSSFVIFGMPSAVIIKKTGYKGGMMVAFLLMALGFLMIVPAAITNSFPLFLLALFVNGLGQTVLNAAVNPYITILGPEDSAASRISIMGIASKFSYAGASLILAVFMNLANVEIKDTIVPFIAIAAVLVILGILLYFAPLPQVKAAGEDATQADNSFSESANSKTSIFQFPHLLLGVIALFLYVGVEQLALSTINDFAKNLNLASPQNYVWFASAGMVIGYILGVVLIPKQITQNLALKLCALIGVSATLLIVLMPSSVAVYFVMLLGLANSLIWPAIWPLAIAGLGKFTKTGSSLLVMGIVGAAIIPLGFGYLAGTFSYQKCILDLPSILYFHFVLRRLGT